MLGSKHLGNRQRSNRLFPGVWRRPGNQSLIIHSFGWGLPGIKPLSHLHLFQPLIAGTGAITECFTAIKWDDTKKVINCIRPLMKLKQWRWIHLLMRCAVYSLMLVQLPYSRVVWTYRIIMYHCGPGLCRTFSVLNIHSNFSAVTSTGKL